MTRSNTLAANLAELPGDLPVSKHSHDVDLIMVASLFAESLPAIHFESLHENVIWRDMVALTGTFRTLYSQSIVYKAWSELCKLRQPKRFVIDPKLTRIVNVESKYSWIDIGFTFETTATEPFVWCSGYFSVFMGSDGSWKIWMIRTMLENLIGCPNVEVLNVKTGQPNKSSDDTNHSNRTHGPGSRLKNGHFACIIVGGGQAGLSVAGYLQALGVSYVVLDKYPNIGDSWHMRYNSVKLHTAREYAHLPFGRLYGPDLLEFLTRDHVAEGHRRFAKRYDINIKCGTELLSSSWSHMNEVWTCQVQQSNNLYTLTSSHVVFAIGAGSSQPKMPNYPDEGFFRGKALHSVDYKSAKSWSGLKGVVIGTANTAHDIASDMVAAGLESVTMVQRSATWVLPADHYLTSTSAMYNSTTPTELGDRLNFCCPLAISRKIAMAKLHALAREDSARFDALEKAGFNLERFGDITSVLYEKLGGHYVDVGTSAQISKGMIKVKSDAIPLHYTASGLMFNDGSELEADVIVFATGFVANMKDLVRDYVGDSVADKIDDFWGIDAEGELRGAFKYPGHPGIWFTGGTIGHARFFGRFIALQIKAALMGTPFIRYK